MMEDTGYEKEIYIEIGDTGTIGEYGFDIGWLWRAVRNRMR